MFSGISDADKVAVNRRIAQVPERRFWAVCPRAEARLFARTRRRDYSNVNVPTSQTSTSGASCRSITIPRTPTPSSIAAALTVPMFLSYFDFLSIGTNDLIQYTLAIDRADEAVAHLYDPWHPAVLALIRSCILQARAAGKGVSVCGEMAGDPAFTELLLAMGLRSFSMHPTQVASVKQRVLRADTRRLQQLVDVVITGADPEQSCADWLKAGSAAPGAPMPSASQAA